MFDVVTAGEFLIDFTPSTLADGEIAFVPKPGGAPANVAATVSRLGGKSAFIGKVGADSFGRLLSDVLQREQVNGSGLVTDKSAPTTLAFVHLNEEGERSFTFYRKNCADTLLTRDEINLPMIENSRIFCFGSVSLTETPAREAVMYAAAYAREKGVAVAYDPNYRLPLWKSEAKALEWIKEGMSLADIVKVSEEEMRMMTGKVDLSEGSAALAVYGARLVLVTLGSKGAFARFGNLTVSCPGMRVKSLDSNGAGDAFLGGLLYYLTRSAEALSLSFEKLEQAVTFANIVGALTTTQYGAISAIPNLSEVLKVFNEFSSPSF